QLEAGDIAGAKAMAEAVLAEDSEARPGARGAARAVLSRVHNAEGIERASAGEMEAALFAFRRASDLDPEWGAPHTNLGAAFEALGRLELARTSYERAVAIDGANDTAWFNLARLMRQLGDIDSALAVLDQATAARKRTDA